MISHEFDPLVVKVLSNMPFTMHIYMSKMCAMQKKFIRHNSLMF